MLLVLAILSAIAIPTFARIQENSLRGAVTTTAQAITDNANAIAMSTPASAGRVDNHTLTQAAEETGTGAPIATDGTLTLTETSGSHSCTAIIAIVNSKAAAGPTTCGDEAPQYPTGYLAGNTSTGPLTANYPYTAFPILPGETTTLTPTITGAASRTETLGTGCLFSDTFYPQAEWESYGLTEADCDPQGGAWRANYTRGVPDITATITTGTLPDGFTLDPGTGNLTGPDNWTDPDPRVPFTIEITITDSSGASAATTVTFTAS